jgi:hypothetical protein
MNPGNVSKHSQNDKFYLCQRPSTTVNLISKCKTQEKAENETEHMAINGTE